MNKIRIAVLVIVLLIGGVMLTVSGVSDIIKMSGIVPDFNYESMENIQKGDIVHGDVIFILDCYAGETTTNTTMGIKTSSYTSREYFIMPLINDDDYNSDLYISISAANEADRNMLYNLSDMTYEYLFNEDDDIVWPEDTYFVVKAQRLDSELYGYMVDWFRETEYFYENDNIESHIVPYDLVIYNPNSAYISLVVGLIMLVIPIVVILILVKKMRSSRESYNEPSFTGYSSGNTETAGTMNTAASNGGSFSESSFTPNAAQSPYIPQPVQPEDFFAKPERKPKAASEQQPTPKPVKSPSPADYSDGIDTSALDTDKALNEQEQAISSNYNPVNDSNTYIDTENLDTERALYEQEQAVASNYNPINDNSYIDTDSLDTDRALYEQEQVVASNYNPVNDNSYIDTDGLDTDKALSEQEQAVSSNYNPINDNSYIDTAELDVEGLDYYDSSSVDEDDDIFDFSNDVDFGDIDASKIEISE